MHRIGTVHGLAGQAEIGTDFARRARQQESAADIREEAEADLGHREPGPFSDDAMAGVRGKPDAAAHHDAVHERDIGFWKFGDPGVEDVLLAPQNFAEITLHLRAFPERADIAAGAEAAFAGAFQHDHGHLGISLERIERLVDTAKHLQRHRIDGLQPIEPDDAGRTLASRDQVAFDSFRHRAPSISLRDTISRMISLVPSRIWCTRRSRTIFSMPYS